MVTYFDNAEEMNGNIVGCPQQSTDQFPRVWLWNPEPGLISEDVFNNSPLIDQTQTYLALKEATDLEMNDFYKTFKDEKNGSCIQTPANLWPSP
jgi:hypothetical protein